MSSVPSLPPAPARPNACCTANPRTEPISSPRVRCACTTSPRRARGDAVSGRARRYVLALASTLNDEPYPALGRCRAARRRARSRRQRRPSTGCSTRRPPSGSSSSGRSRAGCSSSGARSRARLGSARAASRALSPPAAGPRRLRASQPGGHRFRARDCPRGGVPGASLAGCPEADRDGAAPDPHRRSAGIERRR